MSDFSLVMTWAVALIAYIMWIIYVDKPRSSSLVDQRHEYDLVGGVVGRNGVVVHGSFLD